MASRPSSVPSIRIKSQPNRIILINNSGDQTSRQPATENPTSTPLPGAQNPELTSSSSRNRPHRPSSQQTRPNSQQNLRFPSLSQSTHEPNTNLTPRIPESQNSERTKANEGQADAQQQDPMKLHLKLCRSLNRTRKHRQESEEQLSILETTVRRLQLEQRGMKHNIIESKQKTQDILNAKQRYSKKLQERDELIRKETERFEQLRELQVQLRLPKTTITGLKELSMETIRREKERLRLAQQLEISAQMASNVEKVKKIHDEQLGAFLKKQLAISKEDKLSKQRARSITSDQSKIEANLKKLVASEAAISAAAAAAGISIATTTTTPTSNNNMHAISSERLPQKSQKLRIISGDILSSGVKHSMLSNYSTPTGNYQQFLSSLAAGSTAMTAQLALNSNRFSKVNHTASTTVGITGTSKIKRSRRDTDLFENSRRAQTVSGERSSKSKTQEFLSSEQSQQQHTSMVFATETSQHASIDVNNNYNKNNNSNLITENGNITINKSHEMPKVVDINEKESKKNSSQILEGNASQMEKVKVSFEQEELKKQQDSEKQHQTTNQQEMNEISTNNKKKRRKRRESSSPSNQIESLNQAHLLRLPYPTQLRRIHLKNQLKVFTKPDMIF